MKLYNALIKKNQADKIEDVILIKEGFSFAAFILSGIWFLYHKMWREVLLLILLNCALVFLGKFLSTSSATLLEIAFSFMVALNANQYFLDHLKKKNYQFVGVVFGQNLAEAKVNFMGNFKDNPTVFDDAILKP
jgi:hypothetical protein